MQCIQLTPQSYAKSSTLMQNKATSSTALENVYRSLGQRLDEYPGSRCNSQQECIDLVKGGKSVLIRVQNKVYTNNKVNHREGS